MSDYPLICPRRFNSVIHKSVKAPKQAGGLSELKETVQVVFNYNSNYLGC